MANPQPIPFVQLSAELWDAMARFPFKGRSLSCFLCIVRHTYGGLKDDSTQGIENRKTCELSYRRIARYTALPPGRTYEYMDWLVRAKTINRYKLRGGGYAWSIQKDYDRWDGSVEMLEGGKNARSQRSKRRNAIVPDAGTPSFQTPERHRSRRRNTHIVPNAGTPQELSPTDNDDNSDPLSVPNAGTHIQSDITDYTDKDPAEASDKPRSWSDLSQDWQDKIGSLARKFDAVDGFNVWSWIGQALQGRLGNGGRVYEPETIRRVLDAVNPRESTRDIRGVLQSYLNSTQETVEHERRKQEERDASHRIDVSGLVKRVN